MMIDNSYYSSVRYPTSVYLRLVKNHIPMYDFSGTLVTALFSGFKGYSDKTRPSFEESTIERRLGSFSQYAYTPQSDENGEFSALPSINIDFGNAEVTRNICILVDTNKGGGKVLSVRCEGEIVPDSIDIQDDMIVLTAPLNQRFKNINILIEQIEPNTQAYIGAIVVGDGYDASVVKVRSKDIKSVDINLDGDITGGKLTSQTASIKLVDKDGLYSKDFNAVLINHKYIEYMTPHKMFAISPNGILRDDSVNLPEVTINAVDLINLSEQQYWTSGVGYTSDIAEFERCVESLDNVYKQEYAIDSDTDILRDSGYSAEINSINGLPYGSAFHALSFVGARIPLAKNDLLIFEPFQPTITDKIIKFKEQYQKPKLKIYPDIKNLTLSFTNKIVEKEKVVALENISLNFDENRTFEIVLDDAYSMPEDDASYIFINGEQINLSSYGYTVNGNKITITHTLATLPDDLKATIYADKVSSESIDVSHRINRGQEDLTLKSNVYAYPTGFMFVVTDAMTAYERLQMPYQYTHEYSVTARGRIDVDLYDSVFLEIEPNVFVKGIVSSHKLSFNGSHKSNFKIVSLNEEYKYLVPNYELYPSNELYPTNELNRR